MPSPADEPNIFVNSASGKGRGGGHPTGQSNSNNRNFSTKKCVYCGRNGHTIDICYAKHGYPIGHPRYPGRPRFHIKDGSSSSANVNNVTQEADSPHSSMTLSSPSNGLGYGFTKAQYQSLLGLLQQQSNRSAASSQPKHANLTHVPSIGIFEPSNMDFGIFFFHHTIPPGSLIRGQQIISLILLTTSKIFLKLNLSILTSLMALQLLLIFQALFSCHLTSPLMMFFMCLTSNLICFQFLNS